MIFINICCFHWLQHDNMWLLPVLQTILASFYLNLLNYFMNYDIPNKQKNEPNKFHVNFIDTSRHYVPDGRPEHCSVLGWTGPVFSGGVDAGVALRGEGECSCSWCGSSIYSTSCNTIHCPAWRAVCVCYTGTAPASTPATTTAPAASTAPATVQTSCLQNISKVSYLTLQYFIPNDCKLKKKLQFVIYIYQ